MTEIVTGVASVEKSAGYKPMPEDKKKDGDAGLTAREAAEQRAKPETPILARSLDLPENVTLTMQQAGEKLSDLRKADRAAAEIEADDKFAQTVDAERGDTKEAPKPEKVAAPDSDEHVDKLIRKHPKVAEKIAQQAQETEAARVHFKQSIDAAHKVGRAVFHESFPEFANLPVTHEAWNNALAVMKQRDPARHQRADALLRRVDAIEQMQTPGPQPNFRRGPRPKMPVTTI